MYKRQSLNWALSKVRRLEGLREGGYLGDNVILSHLRDGAESKVVGIQPEGKMPVRDGALVEDEVGNPVGQVTSGGFGPSLNKPIAIARIKSKYNDNQSKLFAIVRGKRVAVNVVNMPFVKHNYYRG